MHFTKEQVEIIFNNLKNAHDIFWESYLFEHICWTTMTSIIQFRDEFLKAIQTHMSEGTSRKMAQVIENTITNALYGSFQHEDMSVQLLLDDWDSNEGGHLVMTKADSDDCDGDYMLFIPKEKKQHFVAYLKNMITELEKLD